MTAGKAIMFGVCLVCAPVAPVSRTQRGADPPVSRIKSIIATRRLNSITRSTSSTKSTSWSSAGRGSDVDGDAFVCFIYDRNEPLAIRILPTFKKLLE